MSTSKEYRDFIDEQLHELGDITLRPMMGEYLLYYRGTLVGGIYDERLLIKEVPNVIKYNLQQIMPYNGAKRTMFYVEDIDDKAKTAAIIRDAYEDLRKAAKK